MSSSILTNRKGIITEKGTWTPIATKGMSYQSGPVYDTIESYAAYYRVGKLCYVSCWLYIDVTDAGNAHICVDGLPYAAAEATTSKMQFLASDCVSVTNQNRYGTARLLDNYTKILVMQHDSEAYQRYELGETKLGFSGCYIINSSYGG